MRWSKIWFIGAGPGDPDLITVKATKLLNNADLVIYTGSLVPETLSQWGPKADWVNSASMDLSQIMALIKRAAAKGLNIVRLHTGDPSLYGAIFEQMSLLEEEGLAYDIVPGVTAAFAAAAALKLEYTLPQITQTLILTRISGRTKVPEAENLKSLARHQASLAIYLSIIHIADVQAILEEAYGPNSTCALAYRVSQPEEKIFILKIKDLTASVKKNKISSQALIIASPALAPNINGNPSASRLYDSGFSHGFRQKSS